MKYIHYGSKKFIKEYFTPIKNIPAFVKPLGGLWASPVDSCFGWKDWVMRTKSLILKQEENFKFDLKDTTKVLHIYSITDLESLPKLEDDITNIVKSSFMIYLDFEKISKEYDAIELHLSEEKIESDNMLNSLYWRLYGWDCDSILIMNPNIIKL